jgi:hypothetical protein
MTSLSGFSFPKITGEASKRGFYFAGYGAALDFKGSHYQQGSLDKRGRCAYVPTPSGTAALSFGVIATSANAISHS